MPARRTADVTSAPPAASHPQSAGTTSITATEAQSQFGRVFDLAIRDRVVVITKHNAPRAVLISIEQYEALLRARSAALDSLTNEFDDLLQRLQSRDAKAGLQRAFRASAAELAKAAVSESARRGRAR